MTMIKREVKKQFAYKLKKMVKALQIEWQMEKIGRKMSFPKIHQHFPY